jgi:hypothetical protein
VSAQSNGREGLRSGPIEVGFDPSGTVTIGWTEPSWFGPGRLRGPGFEDGVAADVREIADGVVVLRLEARRALSGIATGTFAEPAVCWHFDPGGREAGDAPHGLRSFGFQYTEFAYPISAGADLALWPLLPFRPGVVLPLGLVAPDGRTLLLAPVDHFHEQIVAVPASPEQLGAGLRVGWHGDLDEVPAGFATEFAVIAGTGPRDCLQRWGRRLRERSGVAPAPRDADVLGTRLSYWTDNGSAYWYRTEPGHDPTSGIVATVDELEARGVPIAAVQLDSWWYPHEVVRPFDTDEWIVPPTGMTRWEPRDDVLPHGVTAFREAVGRRPLVAHCRHLSSGSAYLDEFDCWTDADRAHPKDPALYERLLDQAQAWGVQTFEHDWLIECFLGVRGLRAAPDRAAAWQHGIDDALTARGMTAQWCMATPADFAQASALRTVTSIRTSGDHGYLVGPEVLWTWFLRTNVLARALGLWPYKDVFRSAPEHAEREVEVLLAALSAGPVGIGDPLGAADPALIARTARADGVLVRPDVPIAAIDECLASSPVHGDGLLVGSAHTQHRAGRWSYVVALDVGTASVASTVALGSLGADGPDAAEVFVYDWRRATCERMHPDGAIPVELAPLDWDLRVVAPVLAGGIAIVGDPRLHATAGDARLREVVVDGDRVTATVLGAPGESVEITGWSRRALDARTWTPAVGTTEVEAPRADATGTWNCWLTVPATGWLHLDLGLR